MLAYLVKNPYDYQKQMAEYTSKVFIDKQLAVEYLNSINIEINKHGLAFVPTFDSFELITDQFMEQILQPKELHETNTNSSL